ncbi:DUF7739 domain-containing protein [Kitasatospora sp. NBC_01302]|uniref:DUF7739 domain-containing protein n=1 Tax=Kitasatospora sp. NBC_01302 TaxID=2903575 RepID=UPI002E111FE4|nr:hypothetical protein OG294_27815 [Kitasatospora sp. NBC_01302]
MGWIWDHDRAGYDGWGGHSYTSHAEFGNELSRIAGRQDWAALSILFDRHTGDPFDVPNQQAGRIAEALTALAPHMTPAWAPRTREIAAAARAAHRAGAVWHWG